MAGVRQHSRNLFALCGSTFFFMSSYFTTVTLQSSFNTRRDFGLTSLAALYGFYSLSCFISPVVITTLNTKWTIVFSSILYCIFIGVNIYPRFFTLIPVAALVGLSAGPLWSAQASHLTTTALNLALLTKENASRVISRFNGIFYLFYVACLIPGTLISSLILHGGGAISLGAHKSTSSLNQCGANSCIYRQNTFVPSNLMNSTYNVTSYMIETPSVKTRLTLFAILAGWGLLGSIIALLLLDPLRSFCKVVPHPRDFYDHTMSIFKVMRKGKFLLLVPLIAFTSLEVGFTYATFTKFFVTCSIGVQNVGFTMSAYGVGGLLAAVLSGGLVRYTGRLPLLTAGFLCQVSLLVLMLMWVPHVGHEWQIYGMAVMSGVGGSIRLTQICAFLGVLFPRDQEAAFTAFNIFSGIAYSVYFALEIIHQICVVYLIYTLLAWLVLAMALYYSVEWKTRRVGFLSINDEVSYEEHWQELDKRTKLLQQPDDDDDDDDEKQCNNSATTCLNIKETSKSKSKLKCKDKKQRPRSKLLVEEVETVV
ncbi:protein unc-93 homolog A-like [Amphiura filiformis]|uniref:protein unc-93 homolog A-like n=1 Tax=Amphiura filiformis TaxID=82378 RepID=UPI003B2170D8